jgi:DNA-binding Xre family transcriptional regulator
MEYKIYSAQITRRLYGNNDGFTKPYTRIIIEGTTIPKRSDPMRRMTMTENMTPIDKRCIELGISRTELAKRSGVPLRTLEAWARRIRIPRDVYQLHKVAQALDCHIEDIIEPEAAAQAETE